MERRKRGGESEFLKGNWGGAPGEPPDPFQGTTGAKPERSLIDCSSSVGGRQGLKGRKAGRKTEVSARCCFCARSPSSSAGSQQHRGTSLEAAGRRRCSCILLSVLSASSKQLLCALRRFSLDLHLSSGSPAAVRGDREPPSQGSRPLLPR